MKKLPTDGFVNVDDPLHQAVDAMTLEQKLALARLAVSKMSSSISSETEQEAEIVQERRRFQALRALQEQPGQTPASSLSPSATPPKPASN